MKKYIVCLLAFSMLFSFVACTENTSNNQNNFVEIYKQKVTEFIENGDTESAIKALEEGVSATDDEELKKMLDELKNNSKEVSSETKEDSSIDSLTTNNDSEKENSVDTPTEATSSVESTVSKIFDINDYIGWWTETEDVYTTGGMWLDIYDDGGSFLSFIISLSQSGGMRVANTEITFLKENIKDTIIESTFTDSFGNQGLVSIEFLENKIICTISNLQEPYEGADWGIYNGDYVLKHHGTEH